MQFKIQSRGKFTKSMVYPDKNNDHLESTQGPHFDEKYPLHETATVHQCNAALFILFFLLNINICVIVRQKTTLCLMKCATLLNIVFSVICVIFICRDVEQPVILVFFPCCIVFCISGSWRSIAYPPQQSVSSGDVCWLLAYIHYCHLLPSKTVWHTGTKITYRLLQSGLLMYICLWSISAAAALRGFLTSAQSSPRTQKLREVCCLMRGL